MAKPYFYVQIFINQIGFTEYPGVLSCQTQKKFIYSCYEGLLKN